MNYSQKANPNATNSEIDAKIIITHKQLTNLQRDELIEQYVEIVVDKMSHESLIDYVKEEMANYHEKLSDPELIEHVDCYDPELYDELVDNITAQTTEVK